MTNKNEFNGFNVIPEPGSKDAETAAIEAHEALERDFNPGGVMRDEAEEQARDMERIDQEEYTYIKRAEMSGDKRSEEELINELHDLEQRKGDYIMKHQITNQGTNELLDSQDAALIEFAKKEIPSLAAYIEIRKGQSPVSANSIYADWKIGKDLLKK
jgi:hypothetical protein